MRARRLTAAGAGAGAHSVFGGGLRLSVLAATVWLGCTGGEKDGPVPTPSPVAAGDAGSASEKQGAALLEATKGAVSLERAGKKSPAASGAYLYLGDALETGEDGEATVRFPGGRVVELGPEGRFELRDGEGGIVLSVAQGLVLTRNETSAPAKPLPGPSVQLTILTPFGFTKVSAEATDLKLTVTEKEARVDVKLGSVDLVASDGKVTKIGAGQNAKVGTVLDLDPIQVNISAVSGKAEVKRKEDAKWSALGKKSMALSEGDAFRVKDGRVVMAAPGGQGTLSFAKGSEVTMEKAAKGAAGEEAGFDFKKGELQAQSPVKTRLNLGGGVSVTSEKDSQYTLRRTKEGYELFSQAGDVKIEREGTEAATVLGGRTATIPLKGAVKSEEVPREPVVLPSKSAIKVLQSAQSGRLAITWDGEPDKPYRVEVASDPAYKQKLISGVVHQRHVNVVPPLRGSLYWRVFDEGDKEIAKGSASFAPEASTVDLARNRNEVHDGADQTTIYFQDKPPSVTFAWNSDAQAQKYKVQVYKKENLQAPVVEKVVTEDKVMLPEGALGEGAFMWSVKYLDKLGNEVGGTGKMNKLVFTYDNAVPNLTIKAPKNGDPGGTKVRCQGIAPVGAKVMINGRAVPLDEKSRFDTEVAPMGGGLLVFRMVNGASEVYTVRKVRKSK